MKKWILCVALLGMVAPTAAFNLSGPDTHGTLAKVKKIDVEVAVDDESREALGIEKRMDLVEMGDAFEARLASAGLDVVPNGPMKKENRFTVLHLEIWARKSGDQVVFSSSVHLVLGVRPCKGCQKAYAATWVLSSSGSTSKGGKVPVGLLKEYLNNFLDDWEKAKDAKQGG